MSTAYFAFVRRDDARRYHATLPDFPDCRAEVERLADLAEAIRAAVQACDRPDSWPPPTSLERLPRQEADHEGYWLLVDVGAAHG